MRVDDGFTLVTTKKSNRRIRKELTVSSFKEKELSVEEREAKRQRFLKRIASEVLEVSTSSFFLHFLAQIKTHLDLSNKSITSIVCLGLGKFLSCPIARAQLALLIALRRQFSIALVSAYDPAFDDLERRLLREQNIFVDERNLEGKVRVITEGGDDTLSGVTLFYLPHCPKQLTNNLCWSNWCPEALSRCAIVCNSFNRLRESLPARILAKEVRYLDLCAEFCLETPLLPAEENFGFSDVFNDLSLHSFPRVPSSDWSHWAAKECEPVYEEEDVEYVKNDV